MRQPTRQPGWDAQAVRDIADRYYGGFAEMFEAHGWPERGNKMMPAQGARVAETYGGTEAFVKAHSNGRDLNALLDPMAAIEATPPDVWLKSFYGFTPEDWGFLGYSDPWKVDRFLRASRPGALMVIYGAGGAAPAERKKILGLLQLSHVTGTKWDFLSPARIAAEKADRSRTQKWVHAIQAVRAWRVAPEARPLVSDFAPITYNRRTARAIGSVSLPLKKSEAENLFDLDLVEVSVFGRSPVDSALPQPAKLALSPSKPGPVSQSSYMVREAEGPKHLYVLRLKGPTADFLGYDPGNRAIVKVGFSRSPETRCSAHNNALPAGAFEWQVGAFDFCGRARCFPLVQACAQRGKGDEGLA